MYSLIFYVFYKANLKDGPGYAKYNGSIVVAVTLFLHILLLFSIVKKLFFANIDWVNIGYELKKYKGLEILVIITFMVLVFFYYNKRRTEKILNKYIDETNPMKASNIIKIILIMVIPIALSVIILARH